MDVGGVAGYQCSTVLAAIRFITERVEQFQIDSRCIAFDLFECPQVSADRLMYHYAMEQVSVVTSLNQARTKTI